ncbi:low temperature requirement protein A [Paenibacillus solisilvae]|uniref:Low temperature requirement protein A n=1 Tax=Paenibacillus solisilvae TaxID=2486751 RepID=A0ABW0VVB7_9BACL
MSTNSGHAGLLRQKDSPHRGKVSFIELFFDLIFVFAVTQLSHSLLEHFTLMGLLHLAIIMMAVWWVWIFTSWVTNWLDPENKAVRLLLIGIMLIGLLMSITIPDAFEDKAMVFAFSYVIIQIGRNLFGIWAIGQENKGLSVNFQRILAWFLVSGVFWIAGAFVEDGLRLVLWIIALFIEYISPSMGFWVPKLGRTPTTDWDVEGSHMAERCGLFIIIALGESILVTGATFGGLDWNAPAILAFVVSFIGSVAMWWVYFDANAHHGHENITHSDDPSRLARSAYTYIHLFLVSGIIISAVADELVLMHPMGHTDLKTAAVIIGGPVLYLIGNLFFMKAIASCLPAPYLFGIIVLLALFPFAKLLSPLMLLSLTTLVLILSGTWEKWKRDHL